MSEGDKNLSEKEEYLSWYKKPMPYEGVPSPSSPELGGTKAEPWCDYAYKEWEILKKSGIPAWYWKFEPPEFSDEDKLALERYMLKMKENVAKEKMTPFDRWWSTHYGIERDRVPIHNVTFGMLAVQATRALDSFGAIIKPVDLARYPKLHMLGSALITARFASDWLFINKITYAEAEYGGLCYQKEASALINKSGGAQEKGFYDPKTRIRTAPFLNFQMPDPESGAYAPQLWQVRTMREWLRKSGLLGVQPLVTNTCAGAINSASVALGPTIGFREFATIYKKRPEWIHECMRESLKFAIAHSKMVRSAGPDDIFFCDSYNMISPTCLKDVGQYNVELCKQAHYPPGGWILSAGDFHDHIDIAFQQHGKYATRFGTDHMYPIEENVKKCLEYDKMCWLLADWDIIRKGPYERIAAYEKERFKIAMSDPKSKPYAHTGGSDYWIPMEHVDWHFAIVKKYGTYPKGYEQP